MMMSLAKSLPADNLESLDLRTRASPSIGFAVHDSSRLAWNVTLPVPKMASGRYSFEIKLDIPTNLVGAMEPWAALESYARLDGVDEPGIVSVQSLQSFRSAIIAVTGRLARARDGFIRHCTIIAASSMLEADDFSALKLWVTAASTEIEKARQDLIDSAPRDEHSVANEFLSLQLWTVLTDCGRALFETRQALQERLPVAPTELDAVQAHLTTALKAEVELRRKAGFDPATPSTPEQLELLLVRSRSLKKHFERVLFLEVESYQVVNRLAGWSSAIAALLAYLWFLGWQLALARRAAVGSGVILLTVITAVAYASRERLKELGRNWIAGRVQRMFAQRVTHFRLPSTGRHRGAVVIRARESFSQSSAQLPDAVHPDCGATQSVMRLRFTHRCLVQKPAVSESDLVQQVRLSYRLDLSGFFPRLHDAVRGLAMLDERNETFTIVDVPRNYELPVQANLRWGEESNRADGVVVFNKNGLLRLRDNT